MPGIITKLPRAAQSIALRFSSFPRSEKKFSVLTAKLRSAPASLLNKKI